jgi:hypothetical protein
MYSVKNDSQIYGFTVIKFFNFRDVVEGRVADPTGTSIL